MSTIKHHWSLLQKWKFTFEESDDEKTILITGLPSVCDRLASVNDFLDFVKELGHFTGGEIKPAFVKNVLASNACRYAVMFGDSLEHEQCLELIASLAQCTNCFICAHGRPSIIPLMDMKGSKPRSFTGEAARNAHKSENAKLDAPNVMFGPRRVIRRW